MQQIGDAAFQPCEVQRLDEKVVRVHGRRALGHIAGKRAYENDGGVVAG